VNRPYSHVLEHFRTLLSLIGKEQGLCALTYIYKTRACAGLESRLRNAALHRLTGCGRWWPSAWCGDDAAVHLLAGLLLIGGDACNPPRTPAW